MMVPMARNRSAYNCTDSPVVVDADGHTIGGREHGKIDVDEPFAAAALEAGSLLLADDVAHPVPPEPVADEPVVLVDDVAAPAPRTRRNPKETS